MNMSEQQARSIGEKIAKEIVDDLYFDLFVRGYNLGEQIKGWVVPPPDGGWEDDIAF